MFYRKILIFVFHTQQFFYAKYMKRFLIFSALCLFLSCNERPVVESSAKLIADVSYKIHRDTVNDKVSDFRKRLSEEAINIIDPSIKYTPDYVSIAYPNGDVPSNTGVCTDVVIRAYRKLGIDLQKERSEEHTSELQSRPHLVCRLLLEKKKK